MYGTMSCVHRVGRRTAASLLPAEPHLWRGALRSAHWLQSLLMKNADVVMENFRTGIMDKLDLGWVVAREHNPKLIFASASGWGSSGP